jgi:prepilin-type N-terminal cleavage/methylation domain-containing protein
VKRFRPAAQAGLTLVELMITLAIGSIVAMSTFMFMAGQQRIYETQTKLVNLQQTLALASEMMVRMVRAAGTGMAGCVRGDSDGTGSDTGAPPPVGPALPLTAAPATGLRGYLKGTGSIRIPPLWISNGAAGAPDTITVAFGNGSFGSWKDGDLSVGVPAGQATAAVRLPAGVTGMFRRDEFALLLDAASAEPTRAAPLFNDRGCSLFRITDLTATDLLHDNTSDFNPANNAQAPGLIPFDYPAGTGVRHFGMLNWVRFSIQPPATPDAAPALTMQRLDDGSPPLVIARGIADLQVAYACDSSPDDGQLREGPSKATDEWFLNDAGDATPTGCGRPDAVRITLVARSLDPDLLIAADAGNVRPSAEDGAASAIADRYRYRTLTATVYPRN